MQEAINLNKGQFSYFKRKGKYTSTLPSFDEEYVFCFKVPIEYKDIFNNITRQNKSAIQWKNRFYWDSENKFWCTASQQSAMLAKNEIESRRNRKSHWFPNNKMNESVFSDKLQDFLSVAWSFPLEQNVIKKIRKDRKDILSKGEEGKQYLANLLETNKKQIEANCSQEFIDELTRLSTEYVTENKLMKNKIKESYRPKKIKLLANVWHFHATEEDLENGDFYYLKKGQTLTYDEDLKVYKNGEKILEPGELQPAQYEIVTDAPIKKKMTDVSVKNVTIKEDMSIDSNGNLNDSLQNLHFVKEGSMINFYDGNKKIAEGEVSQGYFGIFAYDGIGIDIITNLFKAFKFPIKTEDVYGGGKNFLLSKKNSVIFIQKLIAFQKSKGLNEDAQQLPPQPVQDDSPEFNKKTKKTWYPNSDGGMCENEDVLEERHDLEYSDTSLKIYNTYEDKIPANEVQQIITLLQKYGISQRFNKNIFSRPQEEILVHKFPLRKLVHLNKNLKEINDELEVDPVSLNGINLNIANKGRSTVKENSGDYEQSKQKVDAAFEAVKKYLKQHGGETGKIVALAAKKFELTDDEQKQLGLMAFKYTNRDMGIDESISRVLKEEVDQKLQQTISFFTSDKFKKHLLKVGAEISIKSINNGYIISLKVKNNWFEAFNIQNNKIGFNKLSDKETKYKGYFLSTAQAEIYHILKKNLPEFNIQSWNSINESRGKVLKEIYSGNTYEMYIKGEDTTDIDYYISKGQMLLKRLFPDSKILKVNRQDKKSGYSHSSSMDIGSAPSIKIQGQNGASIIFSTNSDIANSRVYTELEKLSQNDESDVDIEIDSYDGNLTEAKEDWLPKGKKLSKEKEVLSDKTGKAKDEQIEELQQYDDYKTWEEKIKELYPKAKFEDELYAMVAYNGDDEIGEFSEKGGGKIWYSQFNELLKENFENQAPIMISSFQQITQPGLYKLGSQTIKIQSDSDGFTAQLKSDRSNTGFWYYTKGSANNVFRTKKLITLIANLAKDYSWLVEGLLKEDMSVDSSGNLKDSIYKDAISYAFRKLRLYDGYLEQYSSFLQNSKNPDQFTSKIVKFHESRYENINDQSDLNEFADYVFEYLRSHQKGLTEAMSVGGDGSFEDEDEYIEPDEETCCERCHEMVLPLMDGDYTCDHCGYHGQFVLREDCTTADMAVPDIPIGHLRRKKKHIDEELDECGTAMFKEYVERNYATRKYMKEGKFDYDSYMDSLTYSLKEALYKEFQSATIPDPRENYQDEIPIKSGEEVFENPDEIDDFENDDFVDYDWDPDEESWEFEEPEEDEEWIDPSGGRHSGDEEDPTKMYESLTEDERQNMKKEITIGSKVNYKTTSKTNYMKGGTVTGFDLENNRAYVNWPSHGKGSISLNNIELASEFTEEMNNNQESDDEWIDPAGGRHGKYSYEGNDWPGKQYENYQSKKKI